VRRGNMRKGKRRARSLSHISISDSEESSDDGNVAGPSSRPLKKRKTDAKDSKDWDKLEETLLAARKRKAEIQTKAEIEMAKVDAIIDETERVFKK
jgi:hypothetical protein